MTPIELSLDQKNKLIEMCVKLFPENKIEMYYDTDIANSWEEARKYPDCGNDAQVQFIIFNWHTPKAEIYHWFEFCYTFLFQKILVNPYGYESINDYISMNSCFIFGHPVDYLYEGFKKLKL